MLLCDYVLKYQGHDLPVSMPEPGAACEHHGGGFGFGVSFTNLDEAEALTGHTAQLFSSEGRPLAQLYVQHVDRELCVLSGDLIPRQGDLPSTVRVRSWLRDIVRHWTVTNWPPRRAPARH